MAGHRPADWHVLDLDKDPTPGDPQRVRTLAKHLHDFADDVSEALRLVKGMAGEGTLLEWAGKSADVFKEDFADVPKNLKKLKKSYEMCGDALADFWPKLERAQSLADKALVKGREARDNLSSAQSRLTSADSWVTRAGKEADKYKDDPTGSKSAEKPDEAKVRAATRDVQHAKSAQSKAQSDVSDAQDALAAAKKMAEDARKMSSTFKYRFRDPFGGLAADLTAECVSPAASDDVYLQVDRNVRLSLPRGIHWRDAAWLSFGLAVHAPALASRNPEGVLVRVTSFTFPLVHFRSEVAALTMDGWLRQEFDLPESELRVVADAATGAYRFEWGSHAAPFSDDS